MNRQSFQSAAAVVVCALLFACAKPAPKQPADDAPPITLMTQYPLGFDFGKFADAEHLQGAPVREAATSSDNRRDLVYFGAGGDLHVSVKRDQSGREVLSATPFIVPGDTSVEERVAKWDNGVDHNDGQGGRGVRK
jgi:hypothetical protein